VPALTGLARIVRDDRKRAFERQLLDWLDRHHNWDHTA
jgi:hypothetical protein